LAPRPDLRAPRSDLASEACRPATHRSVDPHGELLILGIKVAASTVWEIPKKPNRPGTRTEQPDLGGVPAFPGGTAHPTSTWVTQAVRNLAMDLHDAGRKARFLIRDRDGKYPALFDTILADTGIEVMLSEVRMPRMNTIMGARVALLADRPCLRATTQ